MVDATGSIALVVGFTALFVGYVVGLLTGYESGRLDAAEEIRSAVAELSDLIRPQAD